MKSLINQPTKYTVCKETPSPVVYIIPNSDMFQFRRNHIQRILQIIKIADKNTHGIYSWIQSCRTQCHIIQCVPLATEPGISLIILTPMKILQRNLNRSMFVVWEMKRNVSVVCVCSAPNCCDAEQRSAVQISLQYPH